MEIAIESETRRFFRCPCGAAEPHWVDHLFETAAAHWKVTGVQAPLRAGPWSCDECGVCWNLVLENGKLEITRTKERLILETGVLEIPPQQSAVRFVVQNQKRVNERDEQDLDEQDRYYFEEHTCPMNWLRDVEKIVFRGDEDPHGLFRFVSRETVRLPRAPYEPAEAERNLDALEQELKP